MFNLRKSYRNVRQSVRKSWPTKTKQRVKNFLKENAVKEGVVVTGSGLQYKVLKEGTGPVPKETGIAVVHYRGTLPDGTEVF